MIDKWNAFFCLVFKVCRGVFNIFPKFSLTLYILFEKVRTVLNLPIFSKGDILSTLNLYSKILNQDD